MGFIFLELGESILFKAKNAEYRQQESQEIETNVGRNYVETVRGGRQVESGYAEERAKVILGQGIAEAVSQKV